MEDLQNTTKRCVDDFVNDDVHKNLLSNMNGWEFLLLLVAFNLRQGHVVFIVWRSKKNWSFIRTCNLIRHYLTILSTLYNVGKMRGLQDHYSLERAHLVDSIICFYGLVC